MMSKSFGKILLRSSLQSLKNIGELKENIFFHEGILLSSPELWSEYLRRDSLSEKERIKLNKSIFKYHLRSCARCTPYATFAGSFVASLEEKSQLVLSSNPRKYIRIDMNFLAVITRYLSTIPEIKSQLIYTLNNSIYEVSDAFRYAEYSLHNNDRRYHITAIDQTEVLENLVEYLSEGKSYLDILNLVISKTNAEEAEAEAFVQELIQSQFIISNLEPSVTGKEPLYELLDTLRTMKGIDEIISSFEEIAYLIEHPEMGVEYYQGIESKLKSLNESIQVPKNTIQVDLFHQPTHAAIDRQVIETILEQFDEFSSFYRAMNKSDLDEFKQDFTKRYEERELPLNLVLDADLGIGYAGNTAGSVGDNAMIDDLMVGGGGGNNTTQMTMDSIVAFGQKKFLKWHKNQSPEIIISEEEIKPFLANRRAAKFPESFAIFGKLISQEGLLDKDHFLFHINSNGGPSGANLLGRFALGDKEVEELCKEITKKEEENYPDYIFAEIAHLPQSRIGNILLRPCIRDYEIAYIGKSGLPIERQIDINDILVSVERNEIILKSKRLKKRIIPRLSTAHNYSYNSLPIYKFLCDLQSQGYAYPAAWDWGIYQNQKYLPRVRYKNILIHEARWLVEENDLKDIPADRSSWLAYIQKIQKENGWPDQVLFAQGDNNLYISFDHPLMVEILIDSIKKYKK